MDYTDRILYYLNLFLQYEQLSKDKAAPFKVKAYENAIQAVKNYGQPIMTVEDANSLQGIGVKIRKKIIEIVETNYLVEAEGLEEVEKVREDLLLIHGIGPVKANQLIIEYGIRSIEDLQELALKSPDLFTHAQLLALAYFSELKQRIPRKEMMEHEHFLNEFFLERVPEFSITVVGSYRRGEPSSGDVDLLLTYHGITYTQASKKFQDCIDQLIEEEYVIGVLAKGKTKFLGICRLEENLPARRIDILLTLPQELPCALLYFTGSKEFNVNFRNAAIAQGYTLNEHQLSKIDFNSSKFKVNGLPSLYGNIPDVPEFKTEKDVFDFLGIKYLHPEERKGPIEYLS